MVSTKMLSSINIKFMIIRMFQQHIRMVSNESCDTEDWGNSYWKIIFDKINAALVIIRDLFQKHFKDLSNHKLLNSSVCACYYLNLKKCHFFLNVHFYPNSNCNSPFLFATLIRIHELESKKHCTFKDSEVL